MTTSEIEPLPLAGDRSNFKHTGSHRNASRVFRAASVQPWATRVWGRRRIAPARFRLAARRESANGRAQLHARPHGALGDRQCRDDRAPHWTSGLQRGEGVPGWLAQPGRSWHRRVTAVELGPPGERDIAQCIPLPLVCGRGYVADHCERNSPALFSSNARRPESFH